MLIELLPLLMFAVICLVLMLGYPVAFSLAGTAMLFAGIGISIGHFDASFLSSLSGRLFGTITNVTLLAVPLFVLMGVLLEKSRLAEDLLSNMAALFGRRRVWVSPLFWLACYWPRAPVLLAQLWSRWA